MPSELNFGSKDVLAQAPATSNALVDLFGDPALGSREMAYGASTTLYEADTPAIWLYMIRTGQVRIIQPGEHSDARLREILGPGDWFGVPALAGRATYETIAVAVNRVSVYQVPADQLIAHLATIPAAAEILIRQLASKLEASHEDAAKLVFDDTSERLVKTLLQFSRSAAATADDEDGGVVLQITHQQLAHAVGAARETVSLALTQFRQQNLLRTGRNRLWFNPTALEEFARGGGALPARSATIRKSGQAKDADIIHSGERK